MDVTFTNYSSREWIIDFNTGQIGEPSLELAAVAQDIRLMLSVERFMYPIMSPDFGVTFDDLTGSDYDYIRSEIVARINDALSIDDRVQSTSDFKFERSGDTLKVEFTVTTSFGDFNASTTVGV